MMPAKTKIGIDVPMAKTEGRTAPYDELSTIGIKVKKNNENIVGQNAIEKLMPIRYELIFPSPFHLGRRDVALLIHLLDRNPVRVKPIKMNKGPISFLNIEKKSGRSC